MKPDAGAQTSDAGTPATADSARKARLTQALQQEDYDDQEDGLLTVVLFVVLGLCILTVLAFVRG